MRVRLAVMVASRDLTKALERTHPDGRGAARVRRKLVRYLIRMSSRPTPFGLFAGVGLVRWATVTDLELAAAPVRTRTRPDMEWLSSLIARLEQDPVIRAELRLVANPAIALREQRAWLADGLGPEASVRATTAVRRVIEAAHSPAPADRLAEAACQIPGATLSKAAQLVDRLWAEGFLVTELRPPMTGGDPAAHVCRCLENVPAAREITEGLKALALDLAIWDRLPVETRTRSWPRMLRRAHELHAAPELGSPFQTDLALSLKGNGLHAAVAAEAEKAAELLLRFSPDPAENPQWEAYRRAFQSKYEPGRQVPLLELLDPEAGLGSPFGYTWNSASTLARQRRNRVLLDLALKANREHESVIELTEEQINDLTVFPPTSEDCPPSLELSLFVVAASPAAVDAGDFQVVVGPNVGASAAGRHLGRFADVLGSAALSALEDVVRAESELAPATLPVEVVYQPEPARLANVTIRPALRTHEVVLGAAPGVPQDRVVPLTDLVVSVRSGHFVVSWPAGGTDVIGVQGHMLNSMRAPIPARFLLAAANEGQRQVSPFSWGPAAGFLFLPRIQKGRIVLAPSQWRLDRTGPLGQAPADGFPDAVAAWRATWDVPRHVYLSVADNRLLLDLDEQAHVDVLREELHSVADGQSLHIQEGLPGPRHAWLPGEIGSHIGEVIVPLVRRRQAAHPRTVSPKPPSTGQPVPRTQLRPPGSDWLYLKLYGNAWQQDEVISGPLRTFGDFVTAAGLSDGWFFVRYADPENHLRVRYHGDPSTLLGPLMQHICSWATDLLHDNSCTKFSFETYEPEVDRYGGKHGNRVAEMIFMADSPITSCLLQAMGEGRLSLDRRTLALISVDALLGSLGMTREQRREYFRETAAPFQPGGAVYREMQRDFRRALGLPGFSDPSVKSLLDARHKALSPAAALLESYLCREQIYRSRTELCQSYVHMHLNRILGIDPTQERITVDLLRRTHESLARVSSSSL